MDTPFSYKLSELNISLSKPVRISKMDEHTKQTFSWTTITFLSTSLGIGFLSMPLSAAYTGILYFCLLCLAVALFNYHGNYALLRVGRKLKAKNFPILVCKVLQDGIWSKIINTIIFLNIFGTIVTYTILIQQCITTNIAYFSAIWDHKMPDYLGKLNS